MVLRRLVSVCRRSSRRVRYECGYCGYWDIRLLLGMNVIVFVDGGY